MDLSPERLIAAYCHGIFPMALDDGQIYWFDPEPRAIIPLADFHISRSLRRTLKKGIFRLTTDRAFTAVIQQCAAPAPGRESTWINAEIIDAYIQLHELGLAHSVEAWQDGQLVGGLYGVAVNGLFAGESMFSHRSNASKVALVHLVERLHTGGFALLDIQYMTDHLRQFGAVEIPAVVYKLLLAKALRLSATF